MTSSTCLNSDCGGALPPADSENRYCPRCGAIRVIADPPGQPESKRLVFVGRDSFGSRSRTFYAHTSLVDAPVQVRAFEPLPDGYLPLFPSKHNACALHKVGDSPIVSQVRQEFDEAIADVVVAHGRLWILFENGVLQAYHGHSLESVSTFDKAEWSDSRESTLTLADHFLYCLSKRLGSWVLRAIDAASGDVELAPLNIELESPKVIFEGLHGVALGRNKNSRFTVEKLHATPDGIDKQPRGSMKVSSSGLELAPWWGTLEQAEFLLCPDGGIRQWMEEDERYDTLWPNEGKAWVGHPHRWKEFLLFPTAGKSGLRLLRIGPSGTFEEIELTTRAGSEESFSSCVLEDRLYFLTREPGSVWNLQIYNLLREELEEPRSINGSQELMSLELQPCAVEGKSHVLISGRGNTKWVFWGWKVEERTLISQLAGEPLAEERIRFHWEGANTWMVRHSRRDKGGIVQCLPI